MKPIVMNPKDLKNVTKYHIITWKNQWKFKKEGHHKAIITCSDKSTLITEAIYYLADKGGYCWIHNNDGSVDFRLSNWYG